MAVKGAELLIEMIEKGRDQINEKLTLDIDIEKTLKTVSQR